MSVKSLSLRQIEAVCEAASRGSFLAASKSLGYSQSAVSQQIVQVEHAIGAKLFDRPKGPRRPTLTPVGEAFVEGMTDLLSRIGRLETSLQSLIDGETGVIRVGTFQSVSANLLPRIVHQLRSEQPQVDFYLREDDSQARLLQSLRDGEIDLAFMVSGDGKDLESDLETVALGRDPYVAVFPKGTPDEPVDVRRLDELPMVGLSGDDACEILISDELNRLGLSPKYVFRSVDNGAVQGMVRAGMGVAVMPLLATDASDPDVAIREFDPPLAPRVIALARIRHRSLSRLAQRFVEVSVLVGEEVLAS